MLHRGQITHPSFVTSLPDSIFFCNRFPSFSTHPDELLRLVSRSKIIKEYFVFAPWVDYSYRPYALAPGTADTVLRYNRHTHRGFSR